MSRLLDLSKLVHGTLKRSLTQRFGIKSFTFQLDQLGKNVGLHMLQDALARALRANLPFTSTRRESRLNI
jgi:hypothetical protein